MNTNTQAIIKKIEAMKNLPFEFSCISEDNSPNIIFMDCWSKASLPNLTEEQFVKLNKYINSMNDKYSNVNINSILSFSVLLHDTYGEYKEITEPNLFLTITIDEKNFFDEINEIISNYAINNLTEIVNSVLAEYKRIIGE